MTKARVPELRTWQITLPALQTDFGNVNIWCIVFFPVLKPLACGRQSRCLSWTYKLPGGQKFSIKRSPLSVGFPQRRNLNWIKRLRVAQEPNRNRKPEPSEPFSQEPNAEPEPPEPFSRNRNRNRNRPLCEIVHNTEKPPSLQEPPEPKTGTTRTVPSPNRNRTEPKRGHPEDCNLWTPPGCDL